MKSRYGTWHDSELMASPGAWFKLPNRSLKSCATNSPTVNGRPSSRCCSPLTGHFFIDIGLYFRYVVTISLIEGRLREGTPESGASAVPARGFAIRSRAARTPPGPHEDRPARSSLDWRMGNAGRSASGRRPRKRGPELKPVGGNPANGKAAARRRKAGASRQDARPRLTRGQWWHAPFGASPPSFFGRPQLSVVVRGWF